MDEFRACGVDEAVVRAKSRNVRYVQLDFDSETASDVSIAKSRKGREIGGPEAVIAPKGNGGASFAYVLIRPSKRTLRPTEPSASTLDRGLRA